MKDKKILKKDFNKNLLDKIKKENIKQIPKSIFIIKHLSIWIFLILSVFIGALSLSITSEYLFSADWFLLHRLGIIRIVTIFMPTLWLMFLILASVLSYYNFIHTEKGYKIRFIKTFVVNILLSLFLGGILYFTGVNHYIEGKIESYIPKYREIFVKDKVTRMVKIWQNEKKGLLIGQILEVKVNKFFLKDYNNKKWTILLDKNTKTDIKHRVNIIVGEKIKIIGEKQYNTNFIAKEIRPFVGRGM